MEKRQTPHLDSEDLPAAAGPAASSCPRQVGTTEKKLRREEEEEEEEEEERKQLKDDRRSADDRPVLIHGLSVQRYRQIHRSVLQPSVLQSLSSAEPTEYVSQVLELKQCLWKRLGRPRLQETVLEDGRVEVTEIFDLSEHGGSC